MKILVIEDSKIQLKLAHQVLSSAGHTVRDAEAADQALRNIKEDRPELILLDLALPGIDGLTLARMLKADPLTRDIPIVAVTCFPEKHSREEALKAGCDAYLQKPLNTRTLSAALGDVASDGSHWK